MKGEDGSDGRGRRASVEGIQTAGMRLRAAGAGPRRKETGAQMVPRHVRIKKLPAKHKQPQVSEGGAARGDAVRGPRPTLSRGGCKARRL